MQSHKDQLHYAYTIIAPSSLNIHVARNRFVILHHPSIKKFPSVVFSFMLFPIIHFHETKTKVHSNNLKHQKHSCVMQTNIASSSDTVKVARVNCDAPANFHIVLMQQVDFQLQICVILIIKTIPFSSVFNPVVFYHYYKK